MMMGRKNLSYLFYHNRGGMGDSWLSHKFRLFACERLRVLTIVTRLCSSQPQWIAARYVVMIKCKKDVGESHTIATCIQWVHMAVDPPLTIVSNCTYL